ncbi:aldo/keto reductase family oxidoreductase [Paenarthrobacter aurescens]|nr:aldo/keto reductase [Paenarthrobacter aurescens]UKA48795.1 aldo/keto reductase [Arthrobacter sp. FW305-123]MDO6144413.1 aldo/keto reductase [Paenarthrobacter aurescens]MDO6148260.1 aldo/keto reductase [Paenarthrobacter aurescens]MDO6159504.1 aldo/keto reductase [Paenarthrobacter aurescens]MDO6163487.1 aldo/keto reductase [Paenarthrobacter aurescens]
MTSANGRGRLIYGCMGLGGPWDGTSYGAAEIDHAAAVIEAAQGIGVELFDHADIYRSGKSEAVFGEVLARSQGLREKILLQTKCGIRLGERGLETHYDLSRDAILERVNQSLKRLQTDYVDVLLLHRPDPLLDPREVADAVGKLMAEGKVRQLGVSNMSAAQIEYLQNQLETPIVANQLEMSLLRRDWLESTVLVNHAEGLEYSFPHGTLEHCMTQGIELQAYGSLAQGRYTGANPEELSPAEAATAAMLEQLAAEKDTTPESVLLGWLMKHPARISPVIGTTNGKRIKACADAASVAATMTRAQWYGLWVAARGNNIP